MSAQLDKARLRFAGERLRNQPGMAREAGERQAGILCDTPAHSLPHTPIISGAYFSGEGTTMQHSVSASGAAIHVWRSPYQILRKLQNGSEGAIEFVPQRNNMNNTDQQLASLDSTVRPRKKKRWLAWTMVCWFAESFCYLFFIASSRSICHGGWPPGGGPADGQQRRSEYAKVVPGSMTFTWMHWGR